MAKLIIRNKNRSLYNLKSKIRRYCRQNEFIFNNYLKLKEFFIRKDIVHQRGDALFEKIYIETISYCNNDCSFCSASAKIGIKRPVDFMPEDLYVKILRELKGISFTGSIAFHCNNEPLLDKRLSTFVRTARTLLKNNYLYLYTNGILIDIDLANDLFDAGLNRIIIDSYSDTHELIPSIKNIVSNSSDLRGEVFVDYRHKTECFGNRAGQTPNAKFVLKRPLNIVCTRPLKEIVVTHDGTVALCCADALWRVTMGNAKNTTLKDIWFSDFFKEVRKKLAAGDRSCTDICKVCDALKFFAPKGI